MPYEQNIFISYAHIDDQPLPPEDKGWITRFHATLEPMLSMRLGRKAKIWRDRKLQGNDVFSDEIVQQFSQSEVLVSILSSRYLDSEWCTREIREFCETARRQGGLVVDNKSRVFKVIKMPVDSQDSLPAEVKDLLGYEFYSFKDGTPLELDPAYGAEYTPLYNQKVAKLAWDITQIVKKLQTETATGPGKGIRAGEAIVARPIVYLAECSFDRKPAREELEGELKRMGYAVLPDQRLPSDEAEYIAAVQGMLERCALSIHLVGENPGGVPDGPSGKSTVVHQNELAVARCRSGGLRRLIWLPQGTDSDQPAHKAFIEALRSDGHTQYGADLITGKLEELKKQIHDTLKKIEEPQPSPAVGVAPAAGDAQGSRLLYLLCDEKDRKATLPLRKWLQQAGLDVKLPAFEGDAAQLRKANLELLTSCDAVLLFYGAGDEGWKRTIDSELKKMPGYRAGKPVLARGTYLAQPGTTDKEELVELGEPGLIDGLAGFDEAAMASFVSQVRAGGQPA